MATNLLCSYPFKPRKVKPNLLWLKFNQLILKGSEIYDLPSSFKLACRHSGIMNADDIRVNKGRKEEVILLELKLLSKQSHRILVEGTLLLISVS